VIRLVSVSDPVDHPQFHEIFSALLGWNGDLGFNTQFFYRKIKSVHPIGICLENHSVFMRVQ